MTDEPQASTPDSEAGAALADQGADSPAPAEGEGEGEKPPEKLKQTVEMKDIGPCKKHIKVIVEREDIDKRLDEKFKELIKDAAVPGFRPGKAPRKVVQRRFGKDVTDQVKGELLLASLEQLAEDHDVAPLTSPNLDPKKIEIPDKGPFVYEFEVEVRPQFELPDYKGLRLKRPVRTFTEEDVDKEQTRLLSRYGQVVPKEEGDAQVGDFLVVDMTTQRGSDVVGTAKEVTIRVDEQVAFKDGVAEKFAEQTRGAKAGDKRTVDIVLSDRVANAYLRGQTVQATLEVKEVKKLRLPELTHEFLHTFGVHNVEQLRERIRSILDSRLEYEQRRSAREQVLQQIDAATQWDLPQDLLARQARRSLARRVMEMKEAGISEDEIQARRRLLEQDTLKSTALALKEHFVLQKIAEAEKIDVGEEEINDEIDRLAEMEGESPRRVRARLEKEDMLETLAAQLIERKALDLVLNNATYEDVEVGKASAPEVATVEEQAVPGEMTDITAEAEAKAKAAEEEAEKASAAGQ
jgi:trigger factor